MNDTRKEYIPPEAEIIILAPDENLALWDWEFCDYNWNTAGVNKTASAVVVNGGLTWAEDGFVLPRETQSD